MRWWPRRRGSPDWNNLAGWDSADLLAVRVQLTDRRATDRADLVEVIAEIDRRTVSRLDPGRRSSSVRVIMEPAIAESEADPNG